MGMRPGLIAAVVVPVAEGRLAELVYSDLVLLTRILIAMIIDVLPGFAIAVITRMDLCRMIVVKKKAMMWP
jgi:hypothetical protein